MGTIVNARSNDAENDAETRPLAGLIQDCHDAGYSFREMSARALRAGHSISHSQLADYAKGRVAKVPDQEQIAAIAAAVDSGVEVVRRAVMGEYWGYEPRELRRLGTPVSTKIAAALPADLSPEEERELARLVHAWVAARRES